MYRLKIIIALLLTQLVPGQEKSVAKPSKSRALYNALDYRTPENFFRIDTIKNKKVVLYNVLKNKRLSGTFDSISYNRFFIIGYKKQEITAYNYTLKELYLPGLRVAKLNPYHPILHVIQDNDLKRINLVGNEYKVGDSPLGMSIESLPRGYTLFKIIKKDDGFYIYSDYVQDLLNKARMTSWETLYKVYHADDVAEIEFCNESFEKIESYGNRTLLIYTKLKNGKYNLNTMDYLYSEKPSPEIEKENAALPKNLDKLSKNGIYKIEKNGLVTYYPIMKDIKYQTLGDFDFYYNFARFELPNGQKGWLSIEGKEYLDE